MTAPTLWYSIVGSGAYIQVSLFADFDTQVSIYLGESCEILTCVDSNDDSTIPGPRSTLSALLEDGVPYFILVHGHDNAAGEFTMVIDTLDSAANDECRDATELILGSYESGSTFAASMEEGVPFCG